MTCRRRTGSPLSLAGQPRSGDRSQLQALLACRYREYLNNAVEQREYVKVLDLELKRSRLPAWRDRERR